MKKNFILYLMLCFCFNSNIYAQDDKSKDTNRFKYSSIGIGIIQTDKTAIGVKASIGLPGSLYFVLDRKVEGVDASNDSYDRVINSARVGIHGGIGDLFSSITASGVSLDIKNIFDLYAELGIKSTSYEAKINSFSKDDAQANVIAGIRFGSSTGWEGKIFIDYSKDSELKIKECNSGEVCTQSVEYILDDETDQKFGAGMQFNINKRSAVTMEMSSSKIFDSSIKIGYLFNF